jgi:hypothetical protein
MAKAYKYILIVFILGATSFLTYQHYTDPIYRLKVGTLFNDEELRIEEWGGRFSKEEGSLFLGFNTRLDGGTIIHLYILNEDDTTIDHRPFFVKNGTDFYYERLTLDDFEIGTYKIELMIDDKVIETTTFIIEE